MKAYRVQGTFLMGRNWSPFSIETIGEDEDAARERVLSTLGSRHRVDRRHIKIDSVTAEKRDEIENAAVEAQADEA